MFEINYFARFEMEFTPSSISIDLKNNGEGSQSKIGPYVNTWNEMRKINLQNVRNRK